MKLVKIADYSIWILLAYIAFLLFYPVKTVNFYNLPMKVHSDTYVAWEILSYEVQFCRYIDVYTLVTKVLIWEDGSEYFLSTVNAPFPSSDSWCWELNPDVIILENDVLPLNLPPGEYHLEATVRYIINPLRTIPHVVESEKFTVLSSPNLLRNN